MYSSKAVLMGSALLWRFAIRHSTRAMAIRHDARLALNTDRPIEPFYTALLEY
jgi:hypothetical protein